MLMLRLTNRLESVVEPDSIADNVRRGWLGGIGGCANLHLADVVDLAQRYTKHA